MSTKIVDQCSYVLPWPPAGVNVNHQYIRGRHSVRLRPEIQGWRDEVALIVRREPRLPKGSLHVGITLEPPNAIKRDIDGPIKPILDAVFTALERDDADVRVLWVKLEPPVVGGRVFVGMSLI